jgi:hypothetical protein
MSAVFCQDKQPMGGCEYSLGSSPNLFYCHLYGGPLDNKSCEQTIVLCPSDTVRLMMTYFCVPDGTASGFQWKDHGVNINGETSPNYTVSDTGLYCLTFGCNGSPGGGLITMGNIHIVCPSIGITETAIPIFHLFPNPANKKLTIQLDNFEKTTIRIYNTLGEVVLITKLNGKTSEIDISSLNNGVYFVSLDNDKGASRQKIIKNAH